MKLATLCYVQSADSTLMLQRITRSEDIHFGKWNGLGGKLQQGESPEEGVIREVAEESGLWIEEPRLAGLLTFPEFKDGEDWYVYAYTADRFSGTLRRECEEGHLAWIRTDQVLDLTLWEGDRIFLPWIFEQRLFSAKFLYRDKRLISHNVAFYR